jgi:hypothetical protein
MDMALRSRILPLLALLFIASTARAQDAPRPGHVTLPLRDYLELVETVERTERERARQTALAESPVASVVEQKTSIVLGEKEAEVTSTFEVLVQGSPKGPVRLPFAGIADEAEVKAPGGNGSGGAAVTAAQGGGALLVVPSPGRYTVRISGRASLEDGGGISRLALAPVLAPVALTEVDLPAGLSWSAPGTVVVEDRVDGGRRKVRLATRHGQAQSLEVRRRVDGGEAEKLLARTVVLTIVQLRPEGPRRHDVVLYEVARGSLGTFTVDLPPGLVVEQAGTDEGEVVPVADSGRLTIHRRKQLAGVGYLVLTSTPDAGAALQLAPVVPQAEPRARYLAVSSSVAADLRPLPEASWSRVDLDDLPQLLGEALAELDLSAAWRLAGKPGVETGLAVSVLPPARSLDTVVRLRETTTLLTVDGTVLHRDRLTLQSGSGAGTALDLTLPASATLWSAQVDDVPVRPVERGGTISVPLGFDSRGEPVVEVVSVLERAIPPGRSQLALSLPQLAPPVLEHRWRLLLPESARYRFRSGDLRPATFIPTAREPWQVLQETPGVLTDRINVGGNESGQQSRFGGNLYGTVTDSEGAPLPGVTVTFFAPGAPLVQVTDEQGQVRFLGIPSGRYRLIAELEGFSNVEYEGVVISGGRNTQIDIVLSAAAEDVITVTADSPLVDERRISAGSRVDRTELDKVPTRPDPGADFAAFEEMRQGLVGGVKPLPIQIPESGKVLLLTGVLPPAQVDVELDVRAKR